MASDTNIGGLEEARRVVSELKSRGVTRFVDLQRANKRHIEEVQSDEEELFDDDDGAPGPPRQRRDWTYLHTWTLWSDLNLMSLQLQQRLWMTLIQPWTWRAWTYLRLERCLMLQTWWTTDLGGR